jgi:hypothetical protein
MDAPKHKNGWRYVGRQLTHRDTWYIVGTKTLGGVKFDKQQYLRGKDGFRTTLSVVAGGLEYIADFKIVDQRGIPSGKNIYLPFRWWKTGPAIITH